MNLWIVFLFVRAAYSAGMADVISSYAKVAVNDGAIHKEITTEPSKLPNTTHFEDYEDFDDSTETTERGQSSDTVLKYANGIINLLALMYKFSGSSSAKVKPSQYSQPRSGDDISNEVNQLAEDRYNPSTAEKKFKAEGYPPVKSYIYNPKGSNGAETYGNRGKTSYDADSNQYMIPNADKATKVPFKVEDAMNPMKDYISQNDVDIQQSYSYEIPQDESSQAPPAPVYYPWMSKPTAKPDWAGGQKVEAKKNPWIASDSHDDSWNGQDEKRPIESYPWMTKPTHDWGEQPEPQEKKKPIENYPWMTYEEEKPEDTFGMVPPPKSRPAPEDDHVYSSPYLHDHDLHDDHEEEHPLKDEDRESKRPYTYYHLGRKLWYVPLLFSMYFIVYIASLILKSLARHKVQFPEKLWDLNDHHHHHGDHSRRGRKIDEATENVYKALEKVDPNKYM